MLYTVRCVLLCSLNCLNFRFADLLTVIADMAWEGVAAEETPCSAACSFWQRMGYERARFQESALLHITEHIMF